jgi:CRISPR-associated endonuclease/helicase Cas3
MILKADQFDAFFHELWGYESFPWQQRLARQVCKGQWPSFIDLPTASGKTACLDIAVFALAVQASQPPAQRTAGRRIFFVVNRRVIVDEANARANRISARLRAALNDDRPESVLRQVAGALREISGDIDAPPLDVALLRGGIYRDNRWARSITQPTIITGTIDQIGSRLLFRGYGVSDAARSIHAALIAQDSVLLLDEAHISRPFAQTLEAIQSYRGHRWATQPLSTPFTFVQMTATPEQSEGELFRLDAADREHPTLAARRNAPKLAKLLIAEKAKGKNANATTEALAEILADEARALLSEDRRTVAIIVNRIATARAVDERLRREKPASGTDNEPQIHLAIGRMRPIDRDALTAAIQDRVGPDARTTVTAPLFVVATQCLEVGADFDFDAVVSECASLDSLRQRFGRLNRTGRPIEAAGRVVIRADQVAAHDDPVYGSALSKTWDWLQSVASNDTVDFGIASMEAMLDGAQLSELLSPRICAPVMFPAYVDAWAQTSPPPSPDPDVTLFLHGPQRGEPDVNVCWRADLPAAQEDTWTQIVSLCPPSSPECMPVPIGIVRAWLAKRPTSDDERSDTLGARTPADDEPRANNQVPRIALAWRGPSESKLIRDPRKEIRPGDTLVLAVAAGGWSIFGHIPDAQPDPARVDKHPVNDEILARVDKGEQAYLQSHDRAILRLTSLRMKHWPADEAIGVLKEWVANPERNLRKDALAEYLRLTADALQQEKPAIAHTLRLLENRKHGLDYQRYPNNVDNVGVVLWNRRRIRATGVQSVLPPMDDGGDATSRAGRDTPILLRDHTEHVRVRVDRSCQLLPIAEWLDTLRTAADMHDWGKADERFQALLVNGDRSDAWAQPTLWAKSACMPVTPAERRTVRRRTGLPDNFRHEMLSLQFAQMASELPADPIKRDLVLHLIASHHGAARPFAPVVEDDDPPLVSLKPIGLDYALTADQRRTSVSHRLDSGIAERFWKLNRRFGWWGLAYLEAILRLGDQCASQREEEIGSELGAELPETR